MEKNLPANAGNTCSIPGLGRSPGEGNGNPFQYSYLGNPMDRGAWQETVRYNLMTKHIHTHTHYVYQINEARYIPHRISKKKCSMRENTEALTVN